MTKALLAGAAGRGLLSAGAGLPNGEAAAGVADVTLVRAWKTSFCGNLTGKSRFAVARVLRNPTSEIASISAPSCRVTLPVDNCSFKVLTGMFAVIQAGAMTGLKPSSSTL